MIVDEEMRKTLTGLEATLHHRSYASCVELEHSARNS